LEIFSCGGTKALALTLFVARVIADDHDATVATNNLALVANLLDAWVNLHVSYSSSGSLRTDLLVPINDSTSGEVVSAEFNNDLVLWKDANVVLTHLAGDMCQDLVSVGQLDSKHCVR
jgi:hypothetical protein